ncbi:Ladderlectin [Nibea albiflora]|uniref:Ladderlectin n=1 Tax=Nibea albiflora TaxID=240163 RepID=A0ACB7ES56_NIBAL|nr:Ladderlectin [Nibea albiflora]
MRIVLLLCAAFALSIATEPVQEVAAAQEMHPDVEPPVQMLDRVQEKEALPREAVGVEMESVYQRITCPPGWSRYGSRCFIFMSEQKTWTEAETHCLDINTNLASVHNLGEYDFIQEVVRSNTGRFTQAWLGGYDAVKENTWLWSDGDSFFYNAWSSGQPDNHYYEHCLAMNRPGDNKWDDVNFPLPACGALFVPVAVVFKPSLKFRLLFTDRDRQQRAERVRPRRLKVRAMARGQQKIQSQQKNAKKAAEKKKGQGADQKTAAKAALVHTCPVCRTQMPDPKTFKQHFESKHPKSPMPPELADVQA